MGGDQRRRRAIRGARRLGVLYVQREQAYERHRGELNPCVDLVHFPPTSAFAQILLTSFLVGLYTDVHCSG